MGCSLELSLENWASRIKPLMNKQWIKPTTVQPLLNLVCWFGLLDCWSTDPGYGYDPQDSNHIETSGEPSELFGGLRSCHGWNCWTCCSNVSFVFGDAWSEERNEPNAVPCGEEHLCAQRAAHREDLSNYTLHVRLLQVAVVAQTSQ